MRTSITLRNIDLSLMVDQYKILSSLIAETDMLDDLESESLWAFLSCIGDALDEKGVLSW
jgi:hypothetical protein